MMKQYKGYKPHKIPVLFSLEFDLIDDSLKVATKNSFSSPLKLFKEPEEILFIEKMY